MSKATTKNTTVELESLRLPELQARFREVVGEISKSPNRKFLIRRIEETLAAQTQTAEPETRTVVREPEAAERADVPPPEPPKAEPETQPEGRQPQETQPESSTADVPAKPTAAAPEAAHDEPPAPATTEPVTGDAQPPAEPASAKPPRGRFAGLSVEQLQAMYLDVVGRSTGSSDRGYLIWKIREAEKGRITVGPVQPRKSEGTATDADVKILPLRLETKVVETMDAAWRERGIKNRMEFFRRALGHYLTHLGATDAAALFTTAQ